MTSMPPFHLAFPVTDLAQARAFYGPRGEPGEQATMFLLDPCGNAPEFKAFADLSRIFAN